MSEGGGRKMKTLNILYREGVGDSPYRAWQCLVCRKINGAKGWTEHQAHKYGREHQVAKGCDS